MTLYSHRRGFTIIEATISMLIVSIMFMASLNMTGAAKLTGLRGAQYDQAHALAHGLITEVLTMPYEDSDLATVSLGLESGEGSGVVRFDFDDVDDFHNWSASPPQHADGNEMVELIGWSRSVIIEWVDSNDPTLPVVTETGIKRITVTAGITGQVEVSLVAYRTIAR